MLFPFTVCSCILTALSDQDLIILTSVVLNSQFDNPNIFAMSGSESLYRRKKKFFLPCGMPSTFFLTTTCNILSKWYQFKQVYRNGVLRCGVRGSILWSYDQVLVSCKPTPLDYKLHKCSLFVLSLLRWKTMTTVGLIWIFLLSHGRLEGTRVGYFFLPVQLGFDNVPAA